VAKKDRKGKKNGPAMQFLLLAHDPVDHNRATLPAWPRQQGYAKTCTTFLTLDMDKYLPSNMTSKHFNITHYGHGT
jgi:hypothetical protein